MKDIKFIIMIFILGFHVSCNEPIKKNVRCIQIVHIGSRDFIPYSTTFSSNDDWCQIEIEFSTDTILVKRNKLTRETVTKIHHFIQEFDLPKNRPNEPHSGYEIRSVYHDDTFSTKYILSKQMNEDFYRRLTDHLSATIDNQQLINFLEEFESTGYFFFN